MLIESNNRSIQSSSVFHSTSRLPSPKKHTTIHEPQRCFLPQPVHVAPARNYKHNKGWERKRSNVGGVGKQRRETYESSGE